MSTHYTYKKTELTGKDYFPGHRLALQHTGTTAQKELCRQADNIIKNGLRKEKLKKQKENAPPKKAKRKGPNFQEPVRCTDFSGIYEFENINELSAIDINELHIAKKEATIIPRLVGYYKKCSLKNLKNPNFIKQTTNHFLRNEKITTYKGRANALYRLMGSALYLLKYGKMTRRATDFYAKSTNQFVKDLKINSTASEEMAKDILESEIPTKFLFQEPLFGYVGDFVNYKLKIVLEIDGDIHLSRVKYDEKRDKLLAKHGFITLRFSNRCIEHEKDVFIGTVKFEVDRRKKLFCVSDNEAV